MAEVTLPYKFTPRDYQIPFFKAMDSGYRRAILCFARRHGKDKCCFNYIVKAMIERVGNYAYIFPTASLARKAAWQNIDSDGFKLLDHIPKELIARKQDQQMNIELVNGSTLTFFGSDRQVSVGTAFKGIVFSEFALQDKTAFDLFRPVVRQNDGFMIVNSTPRGRNHYYDLWEMAKENDEWFTQMVKADETSVFAQEDIQAEIDSGLNPDDVQQEFYCSFIRGIAGNFYGREIDKMELQGRIRFTPYEQDAPVHVTFDLGMNDFMAMIFWQVVGREVRYIDYYQNHNRGLEFYALHMRDKPYIYGDIWFPHDGKVRELGTGISRAKRFEDLMGMTVSIVPDVGLYSGIEYGRKLFNRLYIDVENCAQENKGFNGIEKDCLLDCLRNYQKEWNDKREEYNDHPKKSKWNHGADAHRYVGIVVEKDLMTSNNDCGVSEIEKLNELYGRRRN